MSGRPVPSGRSVPDLFATLQHGVIDMLRTLVGVPEYRHGEQLCTMEAGDALLCDADAPHGPQGLRRLASRDLSAITCPQAREARSAWS